MGQEFCFLFIPLLGDGQKRVVLFQIDGPSEKFERFGSYGKFIAHGQAMQGLIKLSGDG